MKAILLRNYGEANKLLEVDVQVPSCGPQDVLVEVHAAGVTLTDVQIRKGFFAGVWGLNPPFIPGWDYSGRVAHIGANVTQFQPDDRVFGMLLAQGAYAEYLVAGPENVCRMPDDWSFAEAAAFPLAATTAYKAIVEAGSLRRGERLLVLGASGGVGSFAILTGLALGAHVTGSASESKLSYILGLGADALPSDPNPSLWPAHSADLIFDGIGPSMDAVIGQCLRPGGRVVRISGPPPSVAALQAQGIAAQFVGTEPNAERLRQVAQLALQHNWKIPVDRTYPLAGVRQAQEALERRTARGKVVLQIRDDLSSHA
ncbi:NADP-dependent oxidoreductase [Nostoc sp. NIES-2111]